MLSEKLRRQAELPVDVISKFRIGLPGYRSDPSANYGNPADRQVRESACRIFARSPLRLDRYGDLLVGPEEFFGEGVHFFDGDVFVVIDEAA